MRLIDPKAESNRLYVSDFVFEQMQKIPTIDAVPVVRCGECVHYQEGVCDLHSEKPNRFRPGHSVIMFSSDFCSYGERKDGEG